MQFFQSYIVHKYTCIYWSVVTIHASVHTMNSTHVISRCQLNYELLLKLCRQYVDIIIWDDIFENELSKI